MFQVFAKLPLCFIDIIDGSKVGDGTFSFEKCLYTCVENLVRDKNKPQQQQKAVRGKGVVGVIHSEYQPNVTNAIEQAGVREHLQNMNGFDPNLWNWAEIKRDMNSTFELQRDDIIKAREKIEEAEEQDTDEPVTTALADVIQLWPYLFKRPCMKDHHFRLTGRDIRTPLETFVDRKMEYVLLYMTSHSLSNTKNLALRMKLEKYEDAAPNTFMCVFIMVANHFKEKHEELIHTVEVRKDSP